MLTMHLPSKVQSSSSGGKVSASSGLATRSGALRGGMRLRGLPSLVSSSSSSSSSSHPSPSWVSARSRRGTLPATRASLFEGGEGEAQVPDAQGYVDGSAGAFTITKVSFGDIALYSGSLLLGYGFGAYFDFLPGTSLSAVMLIYGFPAALIGFALKYAQLEPVGCRSKPEAIPLRETKATDIQNQIREDVTRFRYGDEQHLDLALERIFTFGRFGGIPRRASPVLTGVREEVKDGEFVLVLEFNNKEGFKQSEWESRLEKIATFFGPGITAEMEEKEEGTNIFLITDGSGAGRGGGEKSEVLPPLMPGLPAREAK